MSKPASNLAAQAAVLALVSAAFCSIYLTQPNLPYLQEYFGSDLPSTSATVSTLIFGFAIANIPFGLAADKWPIKPLVGLGACVLCGSLLWSATAQTLEELTLSRFISGLSIPALTTCLVAWLSQTQAPARLPMVMGNYVAATVLGGFAGRLIGGMLFTSEAWRWSFVFVAVLIAATALTALWILPSPPTQSPNRTQGSYVALLKRPDLSMLFICGGAGLGLFATVFNYLPYRLSTPPFALSSNVATAFYACYLIGIVTAPIAGRLSSRIGGGTTLLGGALVIAVGLIGLLIEHTGTTLLALLILSAGYFTMHSAAVGTLNGKLAAGQGRGRANALYVLFYYIGGSLGIQAGGHFYQAEGWNGLVLFCLGLLTLPVAIAWMEIRRNR